MKFNLGTMPRYRSGNLFPPHDIHYSWTGWPSDSTCFSATPPPGIIEAVTDALRTDALDLESHTWGPDEIHLTVAASPAISPVKIAQRIKGRLDHALRQQQTGLSFSRKVSLRAVGHNRTPVVDQYVHSQLDHVDLADPRYRETLAAVAVSLKTKPPVHAAGDLKALKNEVIDFWD